MLGSCGNMVSTASAAAGKDLPVSEMRVTASADLLLVRRPGSMKLLRQGVVLAARLPFLVTVQAALAASMFSARSARKREGDIPFCVRNWRLKLETLLKPAA